mmetsp:Transcript_40569/g.75535  ORF Transcript_40569/g.75535 Transcript_40569/m.75535 type:complete len:261 (+) Transcript_40569:73-855(+)
MGHPSLPLPRRQVDVTPSATGQKAEVMRALGTPLSQDQTTRSPSWQSYISGELCEDVRVQKGGCWPSTPTPTAMYNQLVAFYMPSDTSAQASLKPALNANAREFVPSSMSPALPPSHAPSSCPEWDSLPEPTQPRGPPLRPPLGDKSLHEKKPGPQRPSVEEQMRLESLTHNQPLWKQHGLKTDVPSQGSAMHSSGQCKPCAWFWKSRGCSNAVFCDYCHLCPPGALKERKKAKIAAIRAGIIAPRSSQAAWCVAETTRV